MIIPMKFIRGKHFSFSFFLSLETATQNLHAKVWYYLPKLSGNALSCLISAAERKPSCYPKALSLCTLWWRLIASFALFDRNMANWEERCEWLWGLRKKGGSLRLLFCFVLIAKTNSGRSKDSFPFLLPHPAFEAKSSSPPCASHTPLDILLPTAPSASCLMQASGRLGLCLLQHTSCLTGC